MSRVWVLFSMQDYCCTCGIITYLSGNLERQYSKNSTALGVGRLLSSESRTGISLYLIAFDALTALLLSLTQAFWGSLASCLCEFYSSFPGQVTLDLQRAAPRPGLGALCSLSMLFSSYVLDCVLIPCLLDAVAPSLAMSNLSTGTTFCLLVYVQRQGSAWHTLSALTVCRVRMPVSPVVSCLIYPRVGFAGL